MGSIHRSGILRKSNDGVRLIVTTILGVAFGFLVGISFPNVSVTKLNLPPSLLSSVDMPIISSHRSDRTSDDTVSAGSDESKASQVHGPDDGLKDLILEPLLGESIGFFIALSIHFDFGS